MGCAIKDYNYELSSIDSTNESSYNSVVLKDF